MAGTHVRDNGADRHPHIHLVVLKRDEAGKAADWSVSCLKGRQGKTDPDPMKELKRAFGKNVEKYLERMVGKENVPFQDHNHIRAASPQPEIRAQQFSLSFRSLVYGLRTVDYVMRGAHPFRPTEPSDYVAREIGALLRIAAVVGERMQQAREARERESEISPAESKASLFSQFIRQRSYGYGLPRSRDRGAELEPDF